jgi:hypothetical protein
LQGTYKQHYRKNESQKMGCFWRSTRGITGHCVSFVYVWNDTACRGFGAEMTGGSAADFMITGQSIKMTNIIMVKIILGSKHFALYIAYCIVFSIITGLIIDLFSGIFLKFKLLHHIPPTVMPRMMQPGRSKTAGRGPR